MGKLVLLKLTFSNPRSRQVRDLTGSQLGDDKNRTTFLHLLVHVNYRLKFLTLLPSLLTLSERVSGGEIRHVTINSK